MLAPLKTDEKKGRLCVKTTPPSPPPPPFCNGTLKSPICERVKSKSIHIILSFPTSNIERGNLRPVSTR